MLKLTTDLVGLRELSSDGSDYLKHIGQHSFYTTPFLLNTVSNVTTQVRIVALLMHKLIDDKHQRQKRLGRRVKKVVKLYLHGWNMK